MKFAKRGDRELVQQKFDKDKIMVTKGGITYNVYDAIQAANVDTDINEVLKKYHCTPDEAAEFMKRKGGLQGIYSEFAELQEKAQTIPQLMELKKHADETFNALPIEIRQKYGHDLNKWFEELNKKSATHKEDKELEKGVTDKGVTDEHK